MRGFDIVNLVKTVDWVSSSLIVTDPLFEKLIPT
jgi:hypothetical protein